MSKQTKGCVSNACIQCAHQLGYYGILPAVLQKSLHLTELEQPNGSYNLHCEGDQGEIRLS